MIVVFMDTQHDTHQFTPVYEGLEDIKLMVNPTQAEVIKVLEENPTEKLLGFGHGSSAGLFGVHDAFVIDDTMLDLLRTREMIGIWCYAREFAKGKGLNGYFTSMFVSNPKEAEWFAFGKVNEEETDAENIKFAKSINSFIRDDVPMKDWVGILNENCDKTKNYVDFNYSNMAYFDGSEPIMTWEDYIRECIEDNGLDF